jgi:two-component system phosphate regulon sensor histidine kinase PhoR
LKLGVRAKLFLISLGLIVVSVAVSYAYLRPALESSMIEGVRRDLDVRARLVAREASSQIASLDDTAAWSVLASDLGTRAEARVTIIRKDGKVIGDSDVPLGDLPHVENHAHRPEVEAALAGRRGESVRYSVTVERRMMYVAEPFRLGGQLAGVARVALPLTQVDAAVSELTRLAAIAGLIALAVAVVLTSVAAQVASQGARSLTEAAERMANGDLATRTRQRGGDELGALGRALDKLAEGLSTTLGDLRNERDRMGGILSGMQDGVLLVDAEGQVALVNPALREMLLLPSDAQGRSPIEVIRHAELKELLDEVAETQEASSREIEVGGLKPRSLLVRATPLPGDQGGIFAVFVDVTDVRRLETMRRDFVANVSHELRTPVTAIRSAAETLETAMDNDPTAARSFLDIIDRNASRLHDLVEDLLDLSRIESQTYRLQPELLDFSTVAEHVNGLFADRAEKKGIRLVTDVPSGTRVEADRRALEHVLSNLVDNAVKYCGTGAEVRLSATVDGKKVRIEVRDTGPGIEERHLPRLFERFYRVDAGRSRELGGTGLGLSIVKHLVDAMGGNIRVKSELGNGTSFSFGVPLASA